MCSWHVIALSTVIGSSCHFPDINYVDILRLVRPLFGIPTDTFVIFGRGKTRTFKPRRDVPEGTKQYQLRKYAEATLVRSHTSDAFPGGLIDFYSGLRQPAPCCKAPRRRGSQRMARRARWVGRPILFSTPSMGSPSS